MMMVMYSNSHSSDTSATVDLFSSLTEALLAIEEKFESSNIMWVLTYQSATSSNTSEMLLL